MRGPWDLWAAPLEDLMIGRRNRRSKPEGQSRSDSFVLFLKRGMLVETRDTAVFNNKQG